MNQSPPPSEAEATSLRLRAEAALAAARAEEGPAPELVDPKRAIHELQVHQIELEMQFEALRASREDTERERQRYRDLYDHAPTGYITLARSGAMADANIASARLLGTEPANLADKRLGMFVLEADRPAFNDFLTRVFTTPGRQCCEVLLAGGDGGDVRIARIEGTLSADGIECRASLTDVTSRKRAESALRLSDRAIRAVSQGIIITDATLADNPIIFANPAFEMITGYKAEDVIGKNCRLLQGEGTEAHAVRELRHAMAEGHPCAVELLNYRKDGVPFWNALFITPARDERGRVTHFIGVMLDVTERRNLERALALSQRMEAVGQLAGGVAHDFNNLLTIILGYSDILHCELAEFDPMQEMVSEIGKAGQRAGALTRQLLTFSRNQVLNIEALNLNAVVADLSKTLGRLLGESIELRTGLHATRANIKADSGQLEQVLINLALNARDAMPRGGVLTINSANVELAAAHHGQYGDLAKGTYVLLTVTDTGEGMDSNTRGRVFEPFFTTKGIGTGTGLGLSMAYGIVKQAGGYIAVESELGHGTTFSIYLPVTTDVPALKGPHVEANESPGGSETVLLVEDDSGVRGLARDVLTMYGYRVIEAGSGSAALQLTAADSRVIDLLITDVVMPAMGGRELAEQLLVTRPHVALLYISGYNDDAMLNHGIVRSEIAFLHKPFSATTLLRKVRDVIDEHRRVLALRTH